MKDLLMRQYVHSFLFENNMTRMNHFVLCIFMIVVIATSRLTIACDPQKQFKPLTSSNNTLDCCALCSAGQYMVEECTAENGTVCKDCPPGHFQDKKNNNKECHKCTPVCDGKRRKVRPCSSMNDIKCECPPGKFYNKDLAFCEDCSHCLQGFVVATNCTLQNNTVCKRAEGFVTTVKTTTQSSTSALAESSTATAVTTSFEPEFPSLTETAYPAATVIVKEYVYVHEPIIYKVLVAVFGLILVVVGVFLLAAYKQTLRRLRGRCRSFTHGTLASAEGSDVSLLWVGDSKLKLRSIPASIIQSLAELLNPPSSRNWLHLAGRLGFTQQQVANYKLHPSEATQSLLQDWGTQDGSTVARLHQELLAMGRADAAQLLHSMIPSCGTLV